MSFQENRKRAQRDWQTFFFDQAASLQKSPFGRRRDEVSFTKRKFFQRNPGSLDLDLFLIATQMNDCAPRSEEHTSELQSRRDLVCGLLLEKKKKKKKQKKYKTK